MDFNFPRIAHPAKLEKNQSIFSSCILVRTPAGSAPAFSWSLYNSGADSSALRASWRKRSRASRALRN